MFDLAHAHFYFLIMNALIVVAFGVVARSMFKDLRRKKFRDDALVRSQLFLDSIFENIPNMVFVKEAATLKFVRFNRAGEALLGYQRKDLIGKNDYDFFPVDQADFFTAQDRRVLEGRVGVDIPEEQIETVQGKRILHTRKIPILGSDGKPEYLLGIAEDITQWKATEVERLQTFRQKIALEERERSAKITVFLDEASTVLSSSLDYHLTLHQLSEFLVRSFSGSCWIDLMLPDGSVENFAETHRVGSEKSSLPIHSRNYSSEAIFTGSSELIGGSILVVPIEIRGLIHGSITISSFAGERDFNEQDLVTAEEVGKRTATSIENAKLYESAQKAIQARDEFLAIASHELKTPLTALKLQLEFARSLIKPELNQAPKPEKSAKMLDTSSAQVNRLALLVDDLLDVSRIDAGKLNFNFESIDLSSLTYEVVERYRGNFVQTGSLLNICGPEESLMIYADRFRMEQVILNILSNASKYGEKKPIDLILSRVGGHIEIACQDHGIGIPAAKLERIFERFERAIAASNISGLGLGLYIAKEIVEAHGGHIWAESVLGNGSRFIINLPTLDPNFAG